MNKTSLVLLIIAVLTAAGAGGLWVAGTLAEGEDSRDFAGPPPADPPGLVCTGRVDGERGCGRLTPEYPGRVARVPAEENEVVQAGAALLELDDRTAQAGVEEARAAVALARLHLEEARESAPRHQLHLAQQAAAVRVVERQAEAAKQSLARAEDLLGKNLLSQHHAAVARARVNELLSLREVESRKLDELKLRSPGRDVEKAEASLARAQAAQEKAEAFLAGCTLKAPSGGTVIRVLARAGDVVGGPGSPPVVYFAPAQRRVIRAEVEQLHAARVWAGQKVRIEDRFDPAQRWSGTVRRVSGWFLPRRDVLVDPTASISTPTLECVLVPDSESPTLRIGQQVRVIFHPGAGE